MKEKTFIHEFLSIGLYDYFYGSSVISFEKHIIECLVDIYGKEEIKVLYDNNDENGFEILIKKYGLDSKFYDNFLSDMSKYESFKSENLKNPSIKSDRASIVEVDIITMFLQKSLFTDPTIEDLSHFENNLLNDFSIIKMHFNSSLNPNRTRDYWNKKKRILSDNVELIEIKPDFLDEFTYARFGININDVKKMDYRMINELNTYIKSKLNEIDAEVEKKGRSIMWNTAISTGNGYVDALLITAIIATEMSLGFIYLFLHMGG